MSSAPNPPGGESGRIQRTRALPGGMLAGGMWVTGHFGMQDGSQTGLQDEAREVRLLRELPDRLLHALSIELDVFTCPLCC